MIIEIDNIPIGEMNFSSENKVSNFGIKKSNKVFQNSVNGIELLNIFLNTYLT